MLLLVRFLSCAVLCTSLLACANAPTHHTVKPMEGDIRIERLYVYSFLDVREDLIGKKMLVELEAQLSERLEASGIKVRQLWFNRSSTRMQYSLNETPSQAASIYSQASSVRVPVGETIRDNAENETAFAPRYRLVAFPAQSRATGTGTGYTVHWDLIDVATGKLAWRSDSRVYNMNWWSSDELPKERAKVLVDGLLAEFQKTGVK